MRSAAIFFLSVAALLLVLFNRAAFYGEGTSSSFIKLDFGALFYGAQWAGFWCAIVSLALFTIAGLRTPFPLLSAKNLLPVLSFGLCIYFLAFSMPEWSNFDRWKDGQLGADVYIQTKLTARRERIADEELKDAFLGNWVGSGGERLRVQEGRATLYAGSQTMEFSETSCPIAPFIRYAQADLRDVGYHFYRAGLLNTPLFKELEDRKYPMYVYTCNGRDLAFVVLDDRMFVVLYDGTSFVFTRRK